MCPRPGRARTGRRRRRRCRARRGSRRQSSSARRPPNRDGFTFTIRGGYGSASMSAIEWIGASQVKRSLCGSSTGRVSSVSAGILEPCVRERLDHAPVEIRVGRLVDDRALVEALEVDRVDGAGLDQLGDQLVGPLAGRVELEAQRRVAIEAACGPARSSAGSPSRSDTTNVTGRGSRPSACGERGAGLAQREVERGALERPAAVQARHVAHGLGREQVELPDVLAEARRASRSRPAPAPARPPGARRGRARRR